MGQPLLFLLALGFGFGPIYQKAGGGNYFEFIGPGIIAMGIIFTAIWSGLEIIWDRQFGFLKETLVAPVSRFNIMIGRTLGGATVSVIQGLLVFLLAIAAGFRPADIWLLPLAFVFMFLIALVFTALGTAIATKMEDMQAFPIIMNFLIMPIFFLSGALFPVSGFPKSVVFGIQFNPLLYGVDALRKILALGAASATGGDFLILTTIAILFISIGGYLFSKIQL